MKEIPLIFTGSMVSALLEDRKTQTRRLTGQLLQPGDRIWVKETWGLATGAHEDPACAVRYKSDGSIESYTVPGVAKTYGAMCSTSDRWRSPMLMPRWASRIVLEVVEPSRMERLQDITEEDAKAEGLPWSTQFGMWCGAPGTDFYFGQARLAFKSWWIHLHGANFWFANPLVYVHTFRRVTP